MYLCNNCGAVFENAVPDVIDNGEFWGFPYHIEGDVCPSCGYDSFEECPVCDLCGNAITSDYIETSDDKTICENCYSVKKFG